MNLKLQEYLYEKYPLLFKQKDLDITQSCMPWGIDCGEGWLSVIDRVCMRLEDFKKSRKLDDNSISFSQVKEKYGTLRMYFDAQLEEVHWDYINDLIDEAEKESAYTCELCGSTKGARIEGGSWYTCRCAYCSKDQEDV